MYELFTSPNIYKYTKSYNIIAEEHVHNNIIIICTQRICGALKASIWIRLSLNYHVLHIAGCPLILYIEKFIANT